MLVRLIRDGDGIELTVADDGKGPPRSPRRAGRTKGRAASHHQHAERAALMGAGSRPAAAPAAACTSWSGPPGSPGAPGPRARARL